MSKTLFIGAIASVLTINSVLADTIVTSRGYVDAADALKQDKITAGTTGNVVLYNGTSNGQTQFSERAIYDGTNDYNSSTDANKLITAGAVDGMVGDVYDYVDDEISNIPTPELPTGTAGNVVTYDSNGEIGGELEIYDAADPNATDPEYLVTAIGVNSIARNALNWASQQITCAGYNGGECVLWNLPNLGYAASSQQHFYEFVD
ncbi:MAG: hypothetical protein IJQ90_02490 [Alphaproteobacteria bacterium]|nr:hypothetical protein [Alphaproteobacteria bacterium]